jgi:hypothetical protein
VCVGSHNFARMVTTVLTAEPGGWSMWMAPVVGATLASIDAYIYIYIPTKREPFLLWIGRGGDGGISMVDRRCCCCADHTPPMYNSYAFVTTYIGLLRRRICRCSCMKNVSPGGTVPQLSESSGTYINNILIRIINYTS